MNFLIFSCLILIHINASIQSLNENEKSNYPLPILYYPEETIYTMTSIESLPRKMSESSENQSVFSHITLLCDQVTTSSHHYKAQQVLKSNEPDIMNKIQPCENLQKRTLHTFSNPLLRVIGDFTLAIGYKISRNTILNGLPTLKQLKIKSNPDRYGVVIYYISSALRGYDEYSALHHFHGYNRSLIPSRTCSDYNNFEITYDDDFYKEISIKDILKYFTEEHQDKLFNGFLIPFSRNEKRYETQLYVPDEQEKVYFVPHRLVPLDDFVEDSERMTTCISSNVVPIYKNISEGPLKNVEEYIQRVAEILYDHTLTIYTLTSSQLVWEKPQVFTPDPRSIQYNYGNWNGRNTQKVYLDFENKKITIPKHVLKIVAYHVPRTYYMVIVIDNRAFERFPSRLCNIQRDPICRSNGWDLAPDEDDEEAIVYCCHVTDVSLIKYMDQFELAEDVFNLNKVIVNVTVHKLLMAADASSERTSTSKNIPAKGSPEVLGVPTLIDVD